MNDPADVITLAEAGPQSADPLMPVPPGAADRLTPALSRLPIQEGHKNRLRQPSGSDLARAALAELEERYELVDTGVLRRARGARRSTFLLHTMHDRLAFSVPIFCMNRGTVGFRSSRLPA